MSGFVHVGDFCPNEACADYGKQQGERQKNIVKCGQTKAGRQRYLCRTCGHTFTETKGTIFYRRRIPADEVIETLAFLAEGSRISSLSRVKGHKEDTILAWLRDAAGHAEAIEEECWPGIGSSAVNWTACGRTWATRVKKRLPGDGRKRPILARHTDRYGHPPACGSGDRQNGDGSQSAGL